MAMRQSANSRRNSTSGAWADQRAATGAPAQIAPLLVGGLAASLGVGGGTLSTPVLSLFSFPIRQAIGAGALFNLIIALPATASATSGKTSAEPRP